MTSTNHRPEIDGLRAVAVSSVVAYHAGIDGFSWGFWGVDVFFVISGYLITGIILRDIGSGGFRLADFWARRVRRLVPAAGVVIAATLGAVVVVGSPLEWLMSSSDAAFASTWAINLSLGLRAVSYFDADAEMRPFLHFWSLAVEEQFYVLWPLLLLAASRLGRRGPHVVIVAIAIGSFALAARFSASSPNLAFFLLPFRMWELALGAIAGFVVVPARLRQPAGLVALVGFAVGVSLLTPTTALPGTLTLLPVLATAIWVNIGPEWAGGRVLETRPFVFIGRISYSLYLWHWPVLVLGRPLVGPGAMPTVVLVGTAVVLAALTQRFVETPVRFHRMLVSSPARSLAAGGLIIALTLVGAFALRRAAPSAMREPRLAALQAVRKDVVAHDDCDDDDGCTLKPGSGPTILVLGDSHAMQWTPAVIAAADVVGADARVVYAGRSACPALSLRTSRPSRRDPIFAACAAFQERIPTVLQRLRPAVVVIANFEGYVEDHAIVAADEDAAIVAVAAAHRRLFAEVAQQGATAVFVFDNPSAFEDPIRCVARRPGRQGGDCEPIIDTGRDALRGAVARETAAAHVVVIDATALACPDRRCSLSLNDVAVWRDRHHLTGAFARSSGPVFAKAFACAAHPAGPGCGGKQEEHDPAR